MEAARPSSKTVLIVDDDGTTRDLFEMLLTRQGFKTKKAASGDEALAGLKGGRFGTIDLILMDLMMPGSGGFDTLQKLQGATPEEIPVIVVSAKAIDSETGEMIRSEPNVKGLMQKPVVAAEFAKKVHEVLGTSSAQKFDGWQG